MSLLTNEERTELLQTAFNAIGKLLQDSLAAPALSLAWDSEVKKRTKGFYYNSR